MNIIEQLKARLSAKEKTANDEYRALLNKIASGYESTEVDIEWLDDLALRLGYKHEQIVSDI